MVNIISGMNFFVDTLNIDIQDVPAAFSFRANSIFHTNILSPDPWASGSSSGILNSVGGNGFFANSGTGTFNGSNYFSLSENYSLNNSMIFLSYEKLRPGKELLLSSATGNSFSTYSGFNVGINDANKLYLKYWNNVEGSFTFTYTGVLSDKNIIFIGKNSSVITLGHFNNNTFEFATQEFEIYENNFINSSNLFIGGTPQRPNWDSSNPPNFSGYIDRFYIFNNIPLVYADTLSKGLFSEPTGLNGNLEEYCYVTGFLSGSGYSYSTVTGVFLSGFQSGTTEITGYEQTVSGFRYSGITGYVFQVVGAYVDSCGKNIDIINRIALSGEIYDEISIMIPLTGTVFTEAFKEIDLIGIISGIENVFVTGLVCDSFLNNIGDVLYKYDDNYLSSLSYKEISLLSTTNGNNIPPIANDLIEIYTETYQSKTLEYNKSLEYDNLNDNYFYVEREFKPNEILLFGNGQAIIDSGYSLIPNGYEIIRSPNFDYFITGTTVETNRFFGQQDSLFYDFFSGQFSAFILNNHVLGKSISDVNFNYTKIFYNGQKLTENIDYMILSPKLFYFQKLSGDSTGDQFGYSVATNSDGTIIVMGGIGNDGGATIGSGAALVFTGNSTVGWTQVQKLSGDSAGDQFGHSVATNSDGTIIVMGGPLHDPNGVTNAGAALVFAGNSTSGWTKVQTLSGDSAQDRFGWSVSTNGDGTVIVMGGPLHDPNGVTNAGAALVFAGNSTSGWTKVQTLSGDSAEDRFGYSVATSVDGSIIVMGGIGNDGGFPIGSGAALIFTGNSTVGWTQVQKLSGDSAGDQFGHSVATNSDGTIIVMGGPLHDPNGVTNAGAALVFAGNSTSGWTKVQTLSGDSAQDRFGWSVSTNGDGTVIVMGGPLHDPNGVTNAGAALVFAGNSTSGWTKVQTLSGDSAEDRFGYSVATSVDGSIIVMGGIGNDGGFQSGSGAALVFAGNSTVGWTQVQKLSGDSTGDQFGYSVATNSDGTVIVMGGRFHDPNGISNAGAALVFAGNSTSGWTKVQTLSGDSAGDQFGYSVATNSDGTVIVMGGVGNDGGATIGSGAALVFTGNSTVGWTQVQKLSGDSAGDQFGHSVATNSDGTVIVMGGVGNDGGTSVGSGAAMIFTAQKDPQGLQNYIVLKNTNIYDNNDRFLLVESNNNFNYSSGVSGTLSIINNFNNNCSQVYFNGIRQKLNNNYIENSTFDLLSGTFREPSLIQETIYNNTDDFFV